MDPIDEDFLVGLVIAGRHSPQSASEMDRFVRLEQEGYVQAKPGLPMTFSLTLKGRAVVEAKRGE